MTSQFTENRRFLSLFALFFLAWSATTPADEEPASPIQQPFALKIGAMAFTSIDTLFVSDLFGGQLSAAVDLSRDLDLDDSVTSEFIEGYYRPSRKSRWDFSYYRMNRRGQTFAGRNIEINDRVFPIGTDISTRMEYWTLKGSYSYLFHSHDNIDLGLSIGLHISDYDLSFSATNPSIDEEESQLLPLPVFGVLFNYGLSEKTLLAYKHDIFFLDYDDYTGTMLDAKISVEHRTFRNVGFELGYVVQTMDIDVISTRKFQKYDSKARGWSLNAVIHF